MMKKYSKKIKKKSKKNTIVKKVHFFWKRNTVTIGLVLKANRKEKRRKPLTNKGLW